MPNNFLFSFEQQGTILRANGLQQLQWPATGGLHTGGGLKGGAHIDSASLLLHASLRQEYLDARVHVGQAFCEGELATAVIIKAQTGQDPDCTEAIL